VAEPRSTSTRGTRIRGASGTADRARDREPLPPPEPVADPTRPRRVIDYALQRRAALLRLFSGGALDSDSCDADPYLLRAARHHGEPSGQRCPVCKRQDLDLVTYTYGDQLGHLSGRVRAGDELPGLATQFGEFRVYVVEVCQACGWNHLTLSYVLGDGIPRRPPPRPRDLLD
jgi:hypothetical protein